MIHDPSKLRLGKAPALVDKRTLQLAKYIGALPPPPPSADWTGKAGAYPMSLNDSLGDCTIAGAAHCIQTWTGNAQSSPVVLPDSTVLAAYEAWCGYNPADPSTDRGGVEIQVLNDWRQNGLGGHAPFAYVAVNPKNPTEIMQAMALFGPLYIGVGLPTSAQNQVVWDVTPTTPGDFGSWDGHCIALAAYNAPGAGNWFQHLVGSVPASGNLTCITWGSTKTLTWAWLAAYCDEAYALVTNDWIEGNGLSPSGFNLAQLQADLAEVTA